MHLHVARVALETLAEGGDRRLGPFDELAEGQDVEDEQAGDAVASVATRSPASVFGAGISR